MRGGYEPWEFFMIFALLLLAYESPKWKGDIGRGERTCVAIDGGWKEDFAGLYIFLSLPLIS